MALTASRQGLWRARPAGQARVRRQKLTRALNIAACIVCVVACAACTCPALTCNHVSCGVVFWASLWLCHVEYRPLAPRGIPVWVVTLVQGSFSLDRGRSDFHVPFSVVHMLCCGPATALRADRIQRPPGKVDSRHPLPFYHNASRTPLTQKFRPAPMSWEHPLPCMGAPPPMSWERANVGFLTYFLN